MINWRRYERGLDLLQVVLCHIPQGTGEDDWRISILIDNQAAKIQTVQLQNTGLERYHYTNLLDLFHQWINDSMQIFSVEWRNSYMVKVLWRWKETGHLSACELKSASWKCLKYLSTLTNLEATRRFSVCPYIVSCLSGVLLSVTHLYSFLDILSKWPLFGSSFFAVKRVSDPKERSDHILALNRHGVHFIDLITHVSITCYMSHFVSEYIQIWSQNNMIWDHIGFLNQMSSVDLRTFSYSVPNI